MEWPRVEVYAPPVPPAMIARAGAALNDSGDAAFDMGIDDLDMDAIELAASTAFGPPMQADLSRMGRGVWSSTNDEPSRVWRWR